MKNSVVKNIITNAPNLAVETEQGTLVARASGDPNFRGITIYLKPKDGSPEILLSTTEFVAGGSNVSAGELIPKDRVLPEMQDKVSESRSADLRVAGALCRRRPDSRPAFTRMETPLISRL